MAAVFTKLEDSPMFRKQIHSLEQVTDELKDRCQKLRTGCNRFMTSLDQAYEGNLSFADSLEAFGAGQDDPISVAIGGPVMTKYVTAFRELGTYKELLRSQVEHMLSERLLQFIMMDIHVIKDCRRRLDKAALGYDRAREKFVSVRKGTRAEVVTELEEDLHNAKSTFEKCRFNLVDALANIEAKKKYEFLESISAVMDAHMRYFKQGYELLKQLEPFIHQVLTYTHQSKEMANIEHDKLAKRIQDFRTEAELSNLGSSSNMDTSTTGDGIHVVGVRSYKKIEALMQSTANGEVQIIKQGYLLKRSSNSRGEWKRRFFVLDSHGTLYYYRNKLNRQLGEDNLGFHIVDLRTSTLKKDADQKDMRFCFRIISPAKTYTLQAENGADQMDWIEKITGVIASLLNSPFPQQSHFGRVEMESHRLTGGNGGDSLLPEDMILGRNDSIAHLLKNILGNENCVECDAPDPDWASLNLGILLCIECSGVHRNLGVHISKVRSITLDVRVWEPVIVDLFHALGNAYCNSVWEELLLNPHERVDYSNNIALSVKKPNPNDPISTKEKYILSKYVEKLLIVKETEQPAASLWEAVAANDVRRTYRLLVASDAGPNTRYEDVNNNSSQHVAVRSTEDGSVERKQYDPVICQIIKDSGEQESCLQGCSLLHLACHVGNLTMLELLLQFGADINLQDFHQRTPLHHCVFKKNDTVAKYLLKRGAQTSIKDGGGLMAFERRMELGAITDEELIILFVA